MVVYGGPDIITDGLVLHLDAANSKSYPGSGNTWTDLSGNGNHGTLTNGPSFISANGGSIAFDGINDSASVPTISSTSDGLTMSLWINLSTLYYASCPCVGQIILVDWGTWYDNWTGIASNGAELYFGVYSTSNRVLYYNGSSGSTLINKWYHIVATFGPSGTSNFLRTYKNGIQQQSGSLGGTGLFTVTAPINIGGWFRFCGNCYFQGQMPQLSIYNRPLTASEILQNYNATKGRYSL